jgi:hypothetical protein
MEINKLWQYNVQKVECDCHTVLGYIEEGKRFESNAAGIILQNKAK